MAVAKTQSKFKSKRNPKADRVPRRGVILKCLIDQGEPTSLARLGRALKVTKADKQVLQQRLDRMQNAGQVLVDRRGRYVLPAKMDLLVGRIIGHPDGYGFLSVDTEVDDLYLAPRQMRKVMHGDRVMARVARIDRRGRREAEIVEVTEWHNKTLVGRLVQESGASFVTPQDRRISHDVLVAENAKGGAKPGDIVVVEITQQPVGHRHPAGRITEVLGEHLAPGMEVDIAIRKYDLPHQWPAAVQRDADAVEISVAKGDQAKRRDLRELAFVTIDGEDARDYDDAVYCEPRGGGWRLFVAIADVSHYVTPGSSLDAEARKRGNSVYFPNQVVPMLPEALSNGVCSLRPDVERLALVCEIALGKRGAVKGYKFYEAVIRSKARMTYTDVAKILVDGEPELRKKYRSLQGSLDDLFELYGLLRRRRQQRGSIDLELPETKIIFDSQHKIDRIVPQQRNDAHKLIEECMLTANICAAQYIAEHCDAPMYRIHEVPDADRLFDLRRFLGELGLQLGGGAKPTAADYADTITAAQRFPKVIDIIQVVMLRSLKQAVYSTEAVGHFALNYDLYTHFTSPIRRYPDLLVHRMIKSTRKGKGSRGKSLKQAHQDISEHCSMTERRADDATRDAEQWLKVEFMLDKVGDEFAGTISGVTNFGIFVRLIESHIEGLVHITELGSDYYHYDPVKYRLTGDRSGQVFRLGDIVNVRVMRANLDDARIDFRLVGERAKGKQTGAVKGKRKGLAKSVRRPKRRP